MSNRLIHEKSPYLLQHAENPVDWYPWGAEAFEKARKEDKPIFLSIGYSTCHWCHVMEEESFVNPDIAKLLNEGFVPIKVDREERPDLDQVYMQAVMAMSGSGGWPMSVFLTPDLKPFYGGTYFPPEDRWGRPGFGTLLNFIRQKWQTDREAILTSAEEVTRLLQNKVKEKAAVSPALDEALLRRAFESLAAQFDPHYSGFGGAPKFPRSHILSFLLHIWKRFEIPDAMRMTEETLAAMARGGMYDQIGGGFHRYSTDARWHVPHFEKMLYDQALLAKSYLAAYQVTHKANYEVTAREILDYVLRDMTHGKGGFYSAEDADSAEDLSDPSHKKEGAYYVWNESEINSALSKEEAEVFKAVYGVRADGNAEHDPQGEFRGKNILYLAQTTAEAAQTFSKTEKQIKELLQTSKKKLYQARQKRLRPHLDDKVLTDWNGLMIASFAYGARVLNEPRYLDAAKNAADFLLMNLKTKDGRLLHRWRDGEAAIPGYLDDYAFLAYGLLELYEAGFDPSYLEQALFLSKEMLRLFWDEDNGGFYMPAADAEKLIVRNKEIYDGAVPSGNSVAALALLKTGRMTMNRELEEKGRALLGSFADELNRFPAGYPQMLMALDFALGPSREIVIAEGKDQAMGPVPEWLNEINHLFFPNQVLLLNPADSLKAEQINRLAAYLKNQKALQSKTTAYICKNYVCDLPLTSIQELKKRLRQD